jgi:hypothetical protein
METFYWSHKVEDLNPHRTHSLYPIYPLAPRVPYWIKAQAWISPLSVRIPQFESSRVHSMAEHGEPSPCCHAPFKIEACPWVRNYFCFRRQRRDDEGKTRELALDKVEFARIWWNVFRSFLTPLVFFEVSFCDLIRVDANFFLAFAQPHPLGPPSTELYNSASKRVEVLSTT